MDSRDTPIAITEGRRTRFWDALTPSDRLELSRAGIVRRCLAGAILFREGELSEAVLIILTGSVKVITVSIGGFERPLAVRGHGEILGETSAVWQVPRSATVQAIDSVEFLSVPRSAFVRILRASPSAALELIRVLGERRRDADHERTEFSGATVAQRVATVLVELAAHYRHTEGAAITLPLTQDELAGLAATSRSGVARALAALRARKVVATAPRQIVVLDLDALRANAVPDVSPDTA